MGRLIKACGQTVDGGSSGTVTTPCDCECEGCCCQWITYAISGTDLTFNWEATSDFLDCLGGGIQILEVRVYFDFCPPYPDLQVVPPDYSFTLDVSTPAHPPWSIPLAADAGCITLLFTEDYYGNEVTRCTVKLTPDTP